MTQTEKDTIDFLRSMKCEPNQKVDMPNGGIYLKNLLNRYAQLVKVKADKESIEAIRNKSK